MTNPDKPLIEVDTEEHPEDDTLGVRVSIDLKFAILAGVLVLVACGTTVLFILQR